MIKILKTIDAISDQAGKIMCWLATLLVALVSSEVIMRYLFNSPTMWNYETSMMVGGSLFAMGWAYALRHHSHVRVDIFYTRLSPRGRAVIDVLGALLLFFPLMAMFTSVSTAWAWQAWEIMEKSVETYWYPIIAPFRTMVAIGFMLITLQGIARFIRDLHLLVRNRAYD
jgi:TRAP-type mannitol/chloroaromatic compound transport system permease small subunit